MSRSDAEIERRSGGLLRVPFVRRCQIDPQEGEPFWAFVVNINTLGAYVACDAPPAVGRGVTCGVAFPGNATQWQLSGIVVWCNPCQRHPVHSLPPGFGVRWQALPRDARARIVVVVAEYVRRHPGTL